MVTIMITTLHEMQHHIRTTFGDSTSHASQATWQAPIAGISQGNRAGPHIWAAVSSLLLDLLQMDGFYANLIAAISLTATKIVGFTFMDDTDLCVTHESDEGKQVVQQMQKAVTQWDGLLWASGGALVPEKCFWYLVDF